jgi:hypothetical protein
MKLIPQFTIRWMLAITAVVAGLFSIVGLAARDHLWAVGVSLGLASVAVALGVYAAFFGILWLFSLLATPFARRPMPAGKAILGGTTTPFGSPQQAPRADAMVAEEPAPRSTGNPFSGESPS